MHQVNVYSVNQSHGNFNDHSLATCTLVLVKVYRNL